MPEPDKSRAAAMQAADALGKAVEASVASRLGDVERRLDRTLRKETEALSRKCAVRAAFSVRGCRLVAVVGEAVVSFVQMALVLAILLGLLLLAGNLSRNRVEPRNSPQTPDCVETTGNVAHCYCALPPCCNTDPVASCVRHGNERCSQR